MTTKIYSFYNKKKIKKYNLIIFTIECPND